MDSEIESMSAWEVMVLDLVKPPQEILESLSPEKTMLLHMTMGIAGEAGEIVDTIKKHVMYNKDLDLENMIEELGDIEFYMEGLRQALNIKREDVLKHNYNKLYGGKNARYKNGYSDVAAIKRADKQ